MLGNGQCNDECNTDECRFDFGDCAGCSEVCPLAFKGDGVCDEKCNTPGLCDFDGGDCEKVSCNQKRDKSAQPCKRSFIGDGQCDELCNIPECDFDKGDCGGECAPGCPADAVGDGFCDEACRQVGSDGSALCTKPEAAGEFDGGDCRGCAPGCAVGWVGDGKCQEACAVPRCNFDLLDCRPMCSDYSDCAGCECPESELGNGECNPKCNTDACLNDRGDCEPGAIDKGLDLIAGLTVVQIALIAVGSICYVCCVVGVCVYFVFIRAKKNQSLRSYERSHGIDMTPESTGHSTAGFSTGHSPGPSIKDYEGATNYDPNTTPLY